MLILESDLNVGAREHATESLDPSDPRALHPIQTDWLAREARRLQLFTSS